VLSNPTFMLQPCSDNPNGFRKSKRILKHDDNVLYCKARGEPITTVVVTCLQNDTTLHYWKYRLIVFP
jgi:hypothetical protein